MQGGGGEIGLSGFKKAKEFDRERKGIQVGTLGMRGRDTGRGNSLGRRGRA